MSDTLPDGRAFEAYRDDIQAYRQRQGLKPVSQTDARLLFEQAARQIRCEPPPVTVSEHADDDEAFRLGLLAHVKAGYDAQRDLLRVRWELAVWLRPYVRQGRPKNPEPVPGLNAEPVPSWSPRAVFEEMRESGMVAIRWSSLLRYLPLADHDWKTITEHAHTVKGALKWCADFKRTPEEREAAKYARRDTRADHDRRTEGHIREIRTLNREVARLQDEVDTDLAAEVAKLRAQVSGLKTDIQAKDRQIARLRKDAAHHRLSARGGPLKEVRATPQWCSKCANPPSDCECGSVPEVAANGNGAGRADLFAHAVVSLPGEEAAT